MMDDDLFYFLDRAEAGEKLAQKLLEEPLVTDSAPETLLVLSIPRGGVVVGVTAARQLGCAHDVIAVKKIGYPGQGELAVGAMAEDGTLVLGRELMAGFNEYIEQSLPLVLAQLESMIQTYRRGRDLAVGGKIVILVDDGIATGETMKAAITWLYDREVHQRPDKVLVAVPVCSLSAARDLVRMADHFVCLAVPQTFWAVGQFYWNFDPVSEEVVQTYLVQDTVDPTPS
jgi:putative phosphoribosyl transferase